MTLKDQLEENTGRFVQLMREVPEHIFNTKPDEHSWSVADVTEHLYRSEFGIPRLFQGETEILTGRKPDSKITKIKQRFLDDDNRIEAKGVILPTEAEKSKSTLIDKFEKNRHVIGELIDSLNPDHLCLKFEHPMMGHLTRREWVIFSIVHTQRHMRQVKRIRRELEA